MHAASLPHPVASNRHVPLPRFPRLFTAGLNRLDDWFTERRLGIRTTGCRAVAYRDAPRYQPLPYFGVARVLDQLQLAPSDVVADLGSGKGRVVCAAARRAVQQVVGVEIDPDLHAIAERNVARLRGARAAVRLERRDAATFDFADVTAVCLFNPFGAETMAAVLGRLHESLRLYRRPVRIAYVNPVCAHQFAAHRWLQLTTTWEMSPWSRIKTPVHFYRTRT